jgi:hypothetical protein
MPKAKKPSKARAKKNPSTAADAYRGFSLQATRFLARLLQAPPGSLVSLEVFEDVGVEQPDGTHIAEQDKSSIAGNPVADRSPGLWRTFANWLRAAEQGILDVHKTVFEIHVSRPVEARMATVLSEASTREQVLAAVTEARKLLSDPILPSSLRHFASTVLSADIETLAAIVQGFSFSVGSGDPSRDIRQQMSVLLVPEEIIEEATLYSLGLIKDTTDALLNSGNPAVMSVDAFRTNLTAYIRRHDRRTILASFARMPGQEEIEAHRLRTYICQLDLVNCDDDDKVTAIKDFLRASVDRTTWSLKGWVDQESFSEFSEVLRRAWKNFKRQVDIELRDRSEVERGQHLYARCSNHQCTLEGLQLPPHFIPGSLHALSDEESVGWHPNYKDALKVFRRQER